MSSCNNSTDVTMNRIITTILATAIIRYIEPQLQSTTFANTLMGSYEDSDQKR